MDFDIAININARVSPERVGAELVGKYKLNIDNYDRTEGFFNGTGFGFSFSKDFGTNIPDMNCFGKQKALLTMEYRYKWPNGTNLLLSSEEIPETLWVFFQKYDPTKPNKPFWGYATYWDYYPAERPNWWQYWQQISFFKNMPYEINKGTYDNSWPPEAPVFGVEAGEYRPYEDDDKYKIFSACGRSISVWDENGEYIGDLSGMHALVMVSRHENKHRTYFLDWWGNYANWEEDQQKPQTDRRDKDGDQLPNDIEISLGLNPNEQYSHGQENLSDTEWIVYRFHNEWRQEILNQENAHVYIKTDWSYPGKQTEPTE